MFRSEAIHFHGRYLAAVPPKPVEAELLVFAQQWIVGSCGGAQVTWPRARGADGMP